MTATAMRIADGTKKKKALPKHIAFSGKTLASLTVAPGKDRVWVYDQRVPKLGFMRTKAGATSFYFVAKVAGRAQRYRLGDGNLAIDQARRLALDAAGKTADGRDPQREKQSARAEQTFAAVFQMFMDRHAKPRLRTADELQQKYKKYLADWGTRKFTDISRSDVVKLHAKIGADHPGAANRLVALIRSVYNWSRDIGFDGTNPAADIRLFPEHRRQRYLLPEELPRFRTGLKAISPDMADLFELALFTGARIDNIKSMEWSEVDFDARFWTIPAVKFKTATPVSVPLVDQAIVILKRRLESRPPPPAADAKPVKYLYVFPSIGESGRLVEHKNAWKTLCKAAKLTDLKTHDLRHSLASWQLAAGSNLSTIGRSLGHANSSTTARYAHAGMDAVRKSLKSAVDAMAVAAKTKKRKDSAK